MIVAVRSCPNLINRLPHRSERVVVRDPLCDGGNYNLLGAISSSGPVAMRIYRQTGTLETIIDFAKYMLEGCGVNGPMNPYPLPNSVIVLDNATIHHAKGNLFARYCATYGVRVEFLPRYSPDLNPIEQCFSSFKASLRRHFQTVLASDDVPGELRKAFRSVTTVATAGPGFATPGMTLCERMGRRRTLHAIVFVNTKGLYACSRAHALHM